MMTCVLVASMSLNACGSEADSENVMATETIESTTETIESTEATQETVQESTQEESLTTEVESTEDPAIESTETAPSTESTETIESEVSNEEVVIDSVAALEERYQELRNSWERKATWTASNGVTIKINDAWADAIGGGGGAAIYYDGTEDLTPNSPFMQACNEYVYGDEAFLNGTDRWNPEVVDVSKLPDIPCASSKQTSVPNSSEFTAYKEAFDEMYGFQVSGKWGANPAYCLQNYGSGIGLTADARRYLWTIESLMEMVILS